MTAVVEPDCARNIMNGYAVVIEQHTSLLYLCPRQYLIEGLSGALFEHSLNMALAVAEPVAYFVKIDGLEVLLDI